MFAKKPKAVESKSKKRLIPAWIWMVVGSMLTLMIGVLLYLWQPFKSVRVVANPQDGATAEQNNTSESTNENTNDNAVKQDDTDVQSNAENATKNNTQDNTSTAKPDDEKVQDGTQKKNYEFYELLPEQEVTPIPDEVVVLEPDTTSTTQNQADVTLKQQQRSERDVDTQNNAETYDGGEVLPEPNEDAENSTNDTDNDANKDNTNSSNATSSDNDPIETMIAKQSKAQAAKPSTTYILQINSFGNAEEADRRRAEVLLAGIDAKVVKAQVGEGDYLYQVISSVYQNKDDVFQAQERLKSSGIDALVVERKK